MHCFLSDSLLSKECFEIILNTMTEGLVVVDVTRIIRYCNKAFEHLVGLPNQEIIGKKCSEMLLCSCNGLVCEIFKKGTLQNVECEISLPGKPKMKLLKNGNVMRDSSMAIIGAIETLTDITALKQSELKLIQLQEQIKQVSNQSPIIGTSHSITEVKELISLAAPTNATVLITGETGTGKELVAKAIHYQSNQNNGPFIKINCSAIPETLLESELFGHAKGSFTGAIKDKVGRFEQADGGTLFLDEIGEISAFIQVKLLRFLQEREFERIGENSTRKSDVRIIAATNRNLWTMVQQGTFRQDLYYRLKVFPILVPPLRERKEDIGVLIDHFIAQFNAQTGKTFSGLTHDAAVALMDYCWPGNVRELENAIEHAFVTCKTGTIDLFDLPLELRKAQLQKPLCQGLTLPQTTTTSSPPAENGVDSTVHHSQSGYKHPISREQLITVLNQCNWNKTIAARQLGFDRTTLWRKMKQMGIIPAPREL